jgi:hypothetical protein
LLESALSANGHVNFYAYMSGTQGGDMRVRYRLRLTDFTYHWPPKPFTHQHGHHEGPQTYGATLIFTLAAIDELTPSRDLSDFVTLTGRTLTPHAMRGLYLVHEPA